MIAGSFLWRRCAGARWRAGPPDGGRCASHRPSVSAAPATARSGEGAAREGAFAGGLIRQADHIGDFLGRKGKRTRTIDENQNAGAAHDVIHLATMHRAKGLDFDRVLVVAPKAYLGDPKTTDQQRKLLYVALSRAARSPVFTCIDWLVGSSGEPAPDYDGVRR